MIGIILLYPSIACCDVTWDDLSNLHMAAVGNHYQIRMVETDQLLTLIGPDVWQGNADIYPVDSTVGDGDSDKKVGHYWSQFLMIAQDWLTDAAESEGGEFLIDFQVIQQTGKLIEYEGTWGFKDQDDLVTTIFTTTAHHWVWVEGDYHFHRVAVRLNVLEDIPDARAVWTELMNAPPDPYRRIAAKTKNNGIVERIITGDSNQHHLYEYILDPVDGWLAYADPLREQAGTAARVVLDSSSSLQSPHEVVPVWADYEAIDTIELHVFRSWPGITLPQGTEIYLDNLLITSPVLDNFDWIEPAITRAKEWITFFDQQEPLPTPTPFCGAVLFDMEEEDPVSDTHIGGNGQGTLIHFRDTTTFKNGNASLLWRYELPSSPTGNWPTIEMPIPYEKWNWRCATALGAWIYFDLAGTKYHWTIQPYLTSQGRIGLGNWNVGTEGIPPQTWVYHEWEIDPGQHNLETITQLEFDFASGDGWEPLAIDGRIDIYLDDITVVGDPGILPPTMTPTPTPTLTPTVPPTPTPLIPAQAFPNIPNLLESVEAELVRSGKPAITMFEFSSQLGSRPIDIFDYMDQTLPYVGGFQYQYSQDRYNDFVSRIALYNNENRWDNQPPDAQVAIYLHPSDIYHWMESYRSGWFLNIFGFPYDVIYDINQVFQYPRIYIPPGQATFEQDASIQELLQTYQDQGGKIAESLYELGDNPFLAIDFEREDPVHAYWISGNGQGLLSMTRDLSLAHGGDYSEEWEYSLPVSPAGNYPIFDLKPPHRDCSRLSAVGAWFYFDLTGLKTGNLFMMELLRPELPVMNLGFWIESGEGIPPESWVYHEWEIPEGTDLEEISYIRMLYHAGDGWSSLSKDGTIRILMDDFLFTFAQDDLSLESIWMTY